MFLKKNTTMHYWNSFGFVLSNTLMEITVFRIHSNSKTYYSLQQKMLY